VTSPPRDSHLRPNRFKLIAGSLLLLALGTGGLWLGCSSTWTLLDQLDREVAWVSIRRSTLLLPGFGSALLVLVPMTLAAAFDRPLRGRPLTGIWIGFLALVAAGGAGWWIGTNALRERAEAAGYIQCIDLARYGLRETGIYWARSPEECPPPDSGKSP